jgi:hypothetical protein
VPTSTDGAVINNSTAVTVNGTAVAKSLDLNSSQLTISGNLSVGSSIIIDGGSELIMNGGVLSAQTISSDTINDYILGYGIVSGSVGSGILIEPYGGTLELTSAVAADVAFGFRATPTTVKLDDPTAFSGTFSSITVGDAIDLVGITASSATYNARRANPHPRRIVADATKFPYGPRSSRVHLKPITIPLNADRPPLSGPAGMLV